MKKRFTPILALCSTMLLSSSLCAMETDVAVTEPAISSADLCKEFSSRLKMSLTLLEGTTNKVTAMKADEATELTEAEQAIQNKIALLQVKLPAVIADLKSVRATLKVISADSWTEWLSKKFSSNAVTNNNEDDIVATSVAQLQVVELFIEEFIGNFATVKKASNNEEALQSITDKLDTVLAEIREVKDTLAPKATLGSMVQSILSKISSIL